MFATPSGKTRARGLGIPLAGETGPFNAITDIAGVEVGYTTLISGEGALEVGKGPVRTGVTAILPRGKSEAGKSVLAGMFSLNGNGELTGAHWVAEVGRCDGPITITNTHSCGLARDATIRWLVERGQQRDWSLPVAGETFDGWLNDINGFHVTEGDVFAALDSAAGGRIEEGSVGGGTGMIAFGFKAGSGTASRRVEAAGERWTVGAFVQANFGLREHLVVAGTPVGRALKDWTPDSRTGNETGSIIAVVATDAPLLPHQLQRLARRIGLGVGRTGAMSGHGSGDIFIAFSTANKAAVDAGPQAPVQYEALPETALNPLFEGTIEAVEEAILDSLTANEAMTGRDGHFVPALPQDEVRRLLRAGA